MHILELAVKKVHALAAQQCSDKTSGFPLFYQICFMMVISLPRTFSNSPLCSLVKACKKKGRRKKKRKQKLKQKHLLFDNISQAHYASAQHQKIASRSALARVMIGPVKADNVGMRLFHETKQNRRLLFHQTSVRQNLFCAAFKETKLLHSESNLDCDPASQRVSLANHARNTASELSTHIHCEIEKFWHSNDALKLSINRLQDFVSVKAFETLEILQLVAQIQKILSRVNSKLVEQNFVFLEKKNKS